MPLIIICGRPCVGKSTAALYLSSLLPSASLVAEECLGGGEIFSGDRAATHAQPAREKASHARFKSAVQRALSRPGDCVIADACNLTKGFRYELHILARNAGAPSCCLWVGPDVPLGSALGVNGARAAAGGATPYADGALRDLWARFEPPDARNRWDAPLLRLPLLGVAPCAAAALAGAAAGAQLLCAGESGGGGCGTPWWGEARWGSATPATGGGGPFLTSRFALSATHAAESLVAARGRRGGVVEDLGAGAQKALRQVADAAAGYGAAPLRGFGARGGGGVVRAGAAPDYFKEDFNGSVCGSEGATDVANMGDFEGMEGAAAGGGGGGAGEGGAAPALAPPVRSCFRRAPPPGAAAPPAGAEGGAATEAATAPPPPPPPPPLRAEGGAPAQTPQQSTTHGEPQQGATNGEHTGDPLTVLLAWLNAWRRGEKPLREHNAAEEEV
jgi:hypothetical protein